jgi:uncharacterized membrane protein YfcA
LNLGSGVDAWMGATGFAPETLALAALMVFCAALVRGLTGFGMAIILVPLLGMLMAPDRAVILGILLQLLIGPAGLPQIFANAQRVSALSIAAVAMAATPLGLAALFWTPPEIARLLIALIAIGSFVAVLLPPRRSEVPLGAAAIGFTGLASGLLTGFAAMPGPPVIPFYLRQPLEPVVARASMMLVFFGTAIAGSLAAALMGRAGWHDLGLAVLFYGPMWLGNHLGGRAFGRIAPPLWRSAVAGLLGIAALSAVLRL